MTGAWSHLAIGRPVLPLALGGHPLLVHRPALRPADAVTSLKTEKSQDCLNSETKMPKHLLKVIGSFFVDIHSTRHDRNLWSASSFQGRFMNVIIEYIG